MLWNFPKKEIEDWLESKTLTFVQLNNARIQLIRKNWLDRYIYSDIHDIFFAGFPIVLHEWLSILATG